MDALGVRELRALLAAGSDAFIEASSSVSDSWAVLRPAVGQWSVLECVEHVAIAEAYMLSQIQKAAPAAAPMVNAAREMAIIKKGADRTRRVEAPEVGRPTGRFTSIAEGLRYFLDCRSSTNEFLSQNKEDLRSLVTSHAVAGRVNVYEMLLLMAVHPVRHAKQIDEIRMF